MNETLTSINKDSNVLDYHEMKDTNFVFNYKSLRIKGEKVVNIKKWKLD
jgi:hypothetical protein